MERTWRVKITLSDGNVYCGVVLARTAADAGVVLGDRVRAAFDVEPGGSLGTMESVDVTRISDEFAGQAINQDLTGG